MGLPIDHSDLQALDAGGEFKRAYNAKAATFDQVAVDNLKKRANYDHDD